MDKDLTPYDLKIKNLLKKLVACKKAQEWAVGKTWQEIFDTCHRGDWLLWLFAKTNPDDLQPLTLAKGHCANTVRHLMHDDKSFSAVDAAIAYGEGKITIQELKAAVKAAYDSADAAYAAKAADAYSAKTVAAAYATKAAAYAADASTKAAAFYAASAAYVAKAADDDAAGKKSKEENQMATANICRQYLPIEIWNITFDKQNY